MRIIKLLASNVKKLKAVEITPDGNLIVIGGKNGQGKTSVLDSIVMALSGERAIPSKPVREGQKEAKITLDLDEFVVQRIIKPNGDSRVEVRSKDGAKYPSPQALLDGFTARFTFDPLGFKRMKSKEQADLVKRVLGLDFTSLDRDRQKCFDQRTEANRAVRELESRKAAAPHYANAPAEEISIVEVAADLERARQASIARERLGNSVMLAENRLAETEKARRGVEQRIEALQREIASLDESLPSLNQSLEDLRVQMDALVVPEAQDLQKRLQEANETNRKVRANKAAASLGVDLEDRKAKADKLTTEIETLDAERQRQLSAAKFPVEGLSFHDNGVSFKAIPFDQLSSAEQLRISMAMGIALNPKLKLVLIEDGSLLDEDSLRLVAEMADEHDAQVLMERVGDGEEVSIVMEDGSVKEDRTAKVRT